MRGENPVCRKLWDSVYGANKLWDTFIQWSSQRQHSKLPSAYVFGQFDANWVKQQKNLREF